MRGPESGQRAAKVIRQQRKGGKKMEGKEGGMMSIKVALLFCHGKRKSRA